MNQLQEKFNEQFSRWGITLSDEIVFQRVRGKIIEKGWCIWFLFGIDEAGEYLDFYASHRMTDDEHIRIRTNGSIEYLPIIGCFRMYSPNHMEDKILEKEYFAENQRVSKMLKEKGFCIEGDEPLSIQLGNFLRTNNAV